MYDYGVYVYIHLSILHNQNDILKYGTKDWDGTYKKLNGTLCQKNVCPLA